MYTARLTAGRDSACSAVAFSTTITGSTTIKLLLPTPGLHGARGSESASGASVQGPLCTVPEAHLSAY
eukprot:1595408-Rhodomonas_salina.2